MPESSGIASLHEHPAQSQLYGVYGTPPPSLGPPMQHSPVYQEMSSMTPQQWALQTLDRSELQAGWLSEAEPGEEAEFSPRWVSLEPDWWRAAHRPGERGFWHGAPFTLSPSSPLSIFHSVLPGSEFGKSQLGWCGREGGSPKLGLRWGTRNEALVSGAQPSPRMLGLLLPEAVSVSAGC